MSEAPEGMRLLINLPHAKDMVEVVKFLLEAYGRLCLDQAKIVPGSEKMLRKGNRVLWLEQETGYTVYVPRGLRI